MQQCVVVVDCLKQGWHWYKENLWICRELCRQGKGSTEASGGGQAACGRAAGVGGCWHIEYHGQQC